MDVNDSDCVPPILRVTIREWKWKLETMMLKGTEQVDVHLATNIEMNILQRFSPTRPSWPSLSSSRDVRVLLDLVPFPCNFFQGLSLAL